MAYEITPQSVGGIFDQAFRLMRDHFLKLTSVMMVFYVPLTLGTDLMTDQMQTGFEAGIAPSSASVGGFVGMWLILMVLYPLAQLQVTAAIADGYLGRDATIRSTLETAARLYLPYVGTAFLFGIFMIPLSLLLILPAIYFMVCWSMIGPVAVVEHKFGMNALKRSRKLVSGSWWRVWGILLLATLLVTIPSMIVTAMSSFIPVVGSILSGITSAITVVFATSVFVVLYVDLRCRKENFDLQLLAEQVHAGDAPSETAPAE